MFNVHVIVLCHTGSPPPTKLEFLKDASVTTESVSDDKSDVPQSVLTTPLRTTAAQSQYFALLTFTVCKVTVAVSEIFQL